MSYAYHAPRLALSVDFPQFAYNFVNNGWVIEEFAHDIPQPRYNFVEVPGRDGMVDLTRATTGRAAVGQRRLALTVSRGFASFDAAKTEVGAIIAGAHGELAVIDAPDGVRYADMELAVTKVEYVGAMNCTARLTIECVGD